MQEKHVNSFFRTVNRSTGNTSLNMIRIINRGVFVYALDICAFTHYLVSTNINIHVSLSIPDYQP